MRVREREREMCGEERRVKEEYNMGQLSIAPWSVTLTIPFLSCYLKDTALQTSPAHDIKCTPRNVYFVFIHILTYYVYIYIYIFTYRILEFKKIVLDFRYGQFSGTRRFCVTHI